MLLLSSSSSLPSYSNSSFNPITVLLICITYNIQTIIAYRIDNNDVSIQTQQQLQHNDTEANSISILLLPTTTKTTTTTSSQEQRRLNFNNNNYPIINLQQLQQNQQQQQQSNDEHDHLTVSYNKNTIRPNGNRLDNDNNKSSSTTRNRSRYNELLLLIEESKQKSMTKNLQTKNNNNLTAIIHIGPMKTGSSGIQEALRTSTKELLYDSYEFGNVQFVGKLHQMHMCFDIITLLEDDTNTDTDIQQQQNKKTMKNLCNVSSLRKIHDVSIQRNHNIIISSEAFWRLNNNLQLLYDYFIAGGWYNIQFVMFYRRYYDWLLSFFNQGNKRHTIPNRDTIINFINHRIKIEYKQKEHPICGKWGEQYTICEYRRYRQQFGSNKVQLYNIHQINLNDVREAVLCTTLGSTTKTCTKLKQRQIEEQIQQEQQYTTGSSSSHIKKMNSHRPLVYEELAYYSLQNRLWTINTNNNLTIVSVTKLIQNYHETINNKTEYDFSTNVTTCISNSAYEWILHSSLEAEKELFPQYYNQYGYNEILHDFQHVKQKFCSVNVQQLLYHNNTSIESIQWKQFFTSL